MRQGTFRELLVFITVATALSAQTASPRNTVPATKAYCHPADDFCFQYPAEWLVLGEVFEGNGIVVAPPQKQAQDLWDSVTAARVIPAPQNKDEALTVAEAISQAESGVKASGQNFETLERRQRMVGGNAAEVVKLRYTENSTGRDWIEELVFIEGPESEIYSVALKTSPPGLAGMEAQFSRIVDSWRLSSATGQEEPSTKAGTPGQPTGSKPKPAVSPKL